MRKGSFDFTNLVCLECGYIFTIPRRTYKLKNNGHIKDLWCPRCKNVNKHYEIRNIDSFMNLDRVMDGDMEDLIEALINEDQKKKLEGSI